ncbi:MAG: cysteine--tRNA ligase [archaeon]
MALKIYNTLKREKVEFRTVHKGVARIYSCGPTVYNYPHIGNLRSFVFSDTLRRYIKYKGYNVLHVMNLTDVDDKTIKGSKSEGVSLKLFTEKYTKFFFDDLAALNIEKVEHYPKATENIPEMVRIVKALLDKGIAYTSDDGSIYFSVSKFKDYGKLSKIESNNLMAGARVKQDEYAKESANDFALWKSYDENDGDVFWETEIGKGRPGWHIECSAMSMKYLGETLDVHTGGIDLIFPHHENEIAQSEAYTGKPFANFWVHCEHLLVNGEKMSKSKGNFYVLKDILSKGYSPKAVRYLLIGTHYRQNLNFTFESLGAATQTVEKFREFMSRLKEVKEGKQDPDFKQIILDYKNRFEEAMDDDLNMSVALSHIFEFMKEINKKVSENNLSRQNALEAYNLMMEFDKVLGIFDFKEDAIPDEIKALAEKRLIARKNKDWAESDRIRDVIKEKGYVVGDSKEGYTLKKA